MRFHSTLTFMLMAAVVVLAVGAAGVHADGAWLDQEPVVQWNQPGMALPTTEALESETSFGRPCSAMARPPETDEDRLVADAGWFLMGGYAAGWGVRVVGGNGAYDGMCRPVGFQYFVFVDGVFAGTVSPEIMNSRFDGAALAPSVDAADHLWVDYVRYGPGDAFCCPSGRTYAGFDIERTTDGPVVRVTWVVTQQVVAR